MHLKQCGDTAVMEESMIRTYEDLIAFSTFEERYEYLQLDGSVGAETFGFDRYLNQAFYRSAEWKAIRDYVLVRDLGCDLACDGFEIRGKILIHHMNPITEQDILKRCPNLLDPNNLICVSHLTHNAIHFGERNLLPKMPIERSPNDTCPWRR